MRLKKIGSKTCPTSIAVEQNLGAQKSFLLLLMLDIELVYAPQPMAPDFESFRLTY